MHNSVVVIPSIRSIDPVYIAAIPEDVPILVVDDSDGSIKPTRDKMRVFTYADQREVMGKNYDLIPHKASACRNFAFYYVHKYTDHDLVITIDDDCLCPANFMASYEAIGQEGEFENVAVEGWYNTISFLGVRGQDDRALYPRGFPYWLRELRYPVEGVRSRVNGRLVCLMGLWSNVLDYDGIDKYLFEDYRELRREVHPVAPLLTVGTGERPTKFALCSMNFGFDRELLPLASQVPMGQEIASRYRLDRFEDIWAGYVMQSLVHKRGNGDLIGVGEPVVQHVKEGNLRREILAEHYGHLMSRYFYEFIDTGLAAITPGPYAKMYSDLFTYLVDDFKWLAVDVECPPLYQRYFIKTFERLERWASLFVETPDK